jgi:hypothetical protein
MLLLSVLALSVLIGQSAFADQKTHYATARELVSLTYDEKALYESVRQAGRAEAERMVENNPKTRDYGPVLVGAVMEVLDAYFRDPETQNKLKAAFARTYVEEFTEPELSELVRFYRTPIGKKVLQKLPAVVQKGWQRGSEIGSQVSSSPKYDRMIDRKLKALQDQGKLPKEF